MEALEKLFGPEASKYMIVLFTHGDKLEQEGIEICKYLESGHVKLQELLNRCGNRYHVFNNKKKRKRAQVVRLIKKIDEMVAANRGMYYSDEMFEEAGKTLKQKPDRDTADQQIYDFSFMPELLQRIILFQAILGASRHDTNQLDTANNLSDLNIMPSS